MGGGAHRTHAIACAWKLENNIVESVLSSLISLGSRGSDLSHQTFIASTLPVQASYWPTSALEVSSCGRVPPGQDDFFMRGIGGRPAETLIVAGNRLS